MDKNSKDSKNQKNSNNKNKKQDREKRSARSLNKGINAGRHKLAKLFLPLIGILLLFSLLTGIINQKKTGMALQQYYLNIAYKIGNFGQELFTGKDQSSQLNKVGLHKTDDGVYLNGKDGSSGQSIDKPQASDGAPVVN